MSFWLTENAIYILAAIGTVISFCRLWSFRGTLGLSSFALFIIAAAYSALDYFFVKIFAVIEYLDFSAFDKMSLFGAVFFMPFAVFALAKAVKVKPALLLDISTPGLIVMLLCGRINCLITGCCYGLKLTENFRWPVREGEIAFYLVLIIIFCVKLKKEEFTGRYYAVFLIAYGVFRFFVEFVRYFPDQDGLWHRGHIYAAAAFAAGIIWFVINRKKTGAETGKSSVRKKGADVL